MMSQQMLLRASPSSVCSSRRVLAAPLDRSSNTASRAWRCSKRRMPSSCAAAAGKDSASTSNTNKDPYELAAVRLQQVLLDASPGLGPLDDDFDALPPENKLIFASNVGTLLASVAFIVLLITGDDAFGGVTLSRSSLDAAALGVAYSLPLVACSVASRLPVARREFPVLERLHAAQAEMLGPLVTGLNMQQYLILLAFLVPPYQLLLLPALRAATGTMATFFATSTLAPLWSSASLRVELGGSLPALLALAAPIVLSAHAAGAATAAALAVAPREVAALREAGAHAPRYFRLTAGDPRAAARAAGAFKSMALLWLLERRDMAQLAYTLSGMSVAYMAAVWQTTGDLSTPMAAATVHLGVECLFTARDADTRAERRRAAQQAGFERPTPRELRGGGGGTVAPLPVEREQRRHRGGGGGSSSSGGGTSGDEQ